MMKENYDSVKNVWNSKGKLSKDLHDVFSCWRDIYNKNKSNNKNNAAPKTKPNQKDTSTDKV